MSPPLVTALYAGLNGLILLWLTWAVISRRRSGRIILGDGGDVDFNKLIRGHANAAETIPVALLLLGLAELIGAPLAFYPIAFAIDSGSGVDVAEAGRLPTLHVLVAVGKDRDEEHPYLELCGTGDLLNPVGLGKAEVVKADGFVIQRHFEFPLY